MVALLAALFATATVGANTAEAQHWRPRKTAVQKPKHKAPAKKRSAQKSTKKKKSTTKKKAKRTPPRRPLP